MIINNMNRNNYFVRLYFGKRYLKPYTEASKVVLSSEVAKEIRKLTRKGFTDFRTEDLR